MENFIMMENFINIIFKSKCSLSRDLIRDIESLFSDLYQTIVLNSYILSTFCHITNIAIA